MFTEFYFCDEKLRIRAERYQEMEQDIGSLYKISLRHHLRIAYEFDAQGELQVFHFEETDISPLPFFEEIAHYVEDGSYIELEQRGDIYRHFRLVFTDGQVKEIDPLWPTIKSEKEALSL